MTLSGTIDIFDNFTNTDLFWVFYYDSGFAVTNDTGGVYHAKDRELKGIDDFMGFWHRVEEKIDYKLIRYN